MISMTPQLPLSHLILLGILAILLAGAHGLADTPVLAPLADDSISSSDSENSLSDTSTDQAVRIGVLANRGSDIAMQEWGPTAKYLSRVLAPTNFVIVPLDFNETYESVKENQVSFICTNPSVFTYLEYHGLAQGIATLQVPGDPTPQAVYGAVIFTASDRDDIQNLADLKGTSLAAVDPTSLGGWQAAESELLHAGITPATDLKSLNFTGTHDAAVYVVLNGTADVGTVRSTQLERMQKEGKIDLSQVRILNDQRAEYPHYPYLLSTSLYPEWPFAAVIGTSQDLSKNVSIALLMMDENDPAALAARGAGWAVVQDYSPVHNLLKVLGLPPYDTPDEK